MESTALALWLNTAFAAFDESAAAAVHSLYELSPGFFTPFMVFISALGKLGIALMLLSAILIVYPKTRRVGTVMLLSLGAGALLTNVVLKPLVLRPRPFADTASIYYQYWVQTGSHLETDFSFPSGHTTAAAAAAFGAFFTLDKKKAWPALLFPVLMAVSRIYLSMHYCTDVIGGIIAGTIGAVIGYFVAKLLPKRWYEIEFFRKKEKTA